MESRLLFAVFALLFAAGVLAQAYTWTDENGVVHYSDVPMEGAEEIELGDLDKRPTPTPEAESFKAPKPKPKTDLRPEYESVELSSPRDEETLWNIETELEVNVLLTPPLKPGHLIRVYYDGIPKEFSSARFTINNVYRGEHTLQVEVVGNNGQLMIRGQPTRFYVRQNSAL